ncbi:ribonuclease HI [Rhodobacter aestuarii]|uniref:Ribonuclease H n=1 Tax=Rhodobacter aestuarii TaxID=453582 RepID=A0A1N7JQN6_9RHOB|nr:ribonuclease H [Rhodobacter aestuarii]PTV96029.1 ribonuclease HI [Rhodobacter aestuarii]SIS51625.1 ribonuclease HI [Rhodobacter aestuarii]
MNMQNITAGALPQDSQTRIEIYPDGSAVGNPGPGGYGAIILRRTAAGDIVKQMERGGRDLNTTNIRMEMTAACVALESLGKVTDEPITVFSDANIVPNGMNDWLPGWKAKGWMTASKKPVKNRDLWERLEAAAAGRNVTFTWLRGHNGNPFNEAADTRAYREARGAEAALARERGY